MLKDGSAVTGQRVKVLPKGMEDVPNPKAVEEVEGTAEEHTMAMVIESAEGLMPTYKEALKCLDWPRWEDTINKELNSLKRSGTWELVKCYKNTMHLDKAESSAE